MELTTALIVKNELENLKILLPVLDVFADEIVIVDTGSTDSIKNFLSQLTFKRKIVYKETNWQNDFSVARNESIKYATKDFIFWLDADDRLNEGEPERILKLKEKLSENQIYALKLLNEADKTISYQLRIFPNNGKIKFQYPVHEQLVFESHVFKIVFEDITITHTGYNDKKLLRKKQLRNLEILKKIENKDFYSFLQIAESYKILRQYNDAACFFEKALLSDKKGFNNELTGFVYVELFKLYSMTNKNDCFKYLEKAKRFACYYPVVYYYIGRELFKEKNFEEAVKYFNAFIKKHNEKKYFNPVSLKIKQSALFFLAKSYYFTGCGKNALQIAESLLLAEPDNKSYQYLMKNLKR